MKFTLTNLALLVMLVILIFISKPLMADDTNTQTNTSGSNTNITGGYESTSTTNNKSTVPPPSANSPSYSSMSQDVCSMGISGSITTGILGISGGKHFTDENCERIKLAKVLQDFGMKVASVAILCQDQRVFKAMNSAGTPCPFQGKIGKDAASMWEKYPELRPDYENHLKRTEIIAKVDAEILAQQLKEEEEKEAEEARIKELEALKKEEEEKANEKVIIIKLNPVAVHSE